MHRAACFLGAAALVALAPSALAQTPASAAPASAAPASAAPASATTDAVATPAPTPDPDPPASPVPCDQSGSEAVMAAARAHFSAGQTHVDNSAWADAARELRAALRYYDSPNSHYLLGTALAGLSRYDEAYNEFDGTIEQAARCAQADQTQGRAPRYQDTVAGALRERDALTPRVALLGVRVPDDAPAGLTLGVNGLPLPRRFWNRLRAYPPGDARVVGEARGHARFVGTTPLDPRRAQWLDVAMVREVPAVGARAVEGSRSPMGPAGAVLASVGGVSALAGAVMFFAGRSEYDVLRRECGGACPPTGDFPGRIDRGQALEAAGIGIFWGGVVVSAVGVTLVILGGRANAASSGGHGGATEQPPRAGLRPRFGLGIAGLEVSF